MSSCKDDMFILYSGNCYYINELPGRNINSDNCSENCYECLDDDPYVCLSCQKCLEYDKENKICLNCSDIYPNTYIYVSDKYEYCQALRKVELHVN